MPAKAKPAGRLTTVIERVPLPSRPPDLAPSFPNFSRLYLELLENKFKIKKDCRDRDWERKAVAPPPLAGVAAVPVVPVPAIVPAPTPSPIPNTYTLASATVQGPTPPAAFLPLPQTDDDDNVNFDDLDDDDMHERSYSTTPPLFKRREETLVAAAASRVHQETKDRGRRGDMYISGSDVDKSRSWSRSASRSRSRSRSHSRSLSRSGSLSLTSSRSASRRSGSWSGSGSDSTYPDRDSGRRADRTTPKHRPPRSSRPGPSRSERESRHAQSPPAAAASPRTYARPRPPTPPPLSSLPGARYTNKDGVRVSRLPPDAAPAPAASGPAGEEEQGGTGRETLTKKDLLFKFDLLRRSYKTISIPEYTEFTDLAVMEAQYDLIVRNLTLDATVENYRTYMQGAFTLMELFLPRLGIDMTGFVQHQMCQMNKYEVLLIEMGERVSMSKARGAQWSPEVRLLGMVLVQTGLFIVTKWLSKPTAPPPSGTFGRTGAGAGPIASQQAPPATPAANPLGMLGSLMGMFGGGGGGGGGGAGGGGGGLGSMFGAFAPPPSAAPAASSPAASMPSEQGGGGGGNPSFRPPVPIKRAPMQGPGARSMAMAE